MIMPEARPSIAIVDDDAPVLKALKRLLGVHGFAASAYQSAGEFLADLSNKRPDCLILDLQMPGMSGFELLQRLRRDGVKIPTIIVTAHGSDDAAERCMAAGAVVFLQKPVQSTTLFEAIAKATASVDHEPSWPH